MRPFIPHALRRFYANGFEENDFHRRWAGLWRKQFKLRLYDGSFISLNKLRPRFSFQSLKRYSVRFAPVNLYMSTLNWLMPERVGEKSKANHAYPIGGEYVVDVDHYLNYLPHSHRTTEEGVCEGCLENSKHLAERFIDEIKTNYRDIRIVFSGKYGFHIHVLDFELRDWVRYDEKHPLRSHELARFRYSTVLNDIVGGFDIPHFLLSSDVLRVITFPESLNGETGLVCSYLGGAKKSNDLKVY